MFMSFSLTIGFLKIFHLPFFLPIYLTSYIYFDRLCFFGPLQTASEGARVILLQMFVIIGVLFSTLADPGPFSLGLIQCIQIDL